MNSRSDSPESMELGKSNEVEEDAKSSNNDEKSPVANYSGCTGSNENDTRTKRQIKKDDSGISVEKSENSSDDDGSKKPKVLRDKHCGEENESSTKSEVSDFPKFKSKIKNRNYRKKRFLVNFTSSDEDNSNSESKPNTATVGDACSSPDSGHQENGSIVDVEMVNANEEDTVCVNKETTDSNTRKQSHVSNSDDSDSDSDNSRSSLDKDVDVDEDKDDKVPSVMLKEKPKHKWFVTKEVLNRQWGYASHRQGSQLFQQRCYGSLHSVQRLELMYKLEAHHGCVNALHFNSSGSLLASGSDDLSIMVWDWALGKMVVSYDSGHKSNVFQVKFLPLQGDTHIVSCGRDGNIRLAELSSTGQCRATRRLAHHRGPAHKLAVQPDTPHVFLSSGEDALVMSVDVRTSKPDKLVYVKEGDRKIALYSIHSNPLNSNEFCVSGRDCYIRIYDKRRVTDRTCVSKFCPAHLVSWSRGYNVHVTCAVFNYNGTEVLGSYNDEDIYLFDRKASNVCQEYVHKYEGHRNNATVKGLSFFGPKSEFIVSGSDCGNIFFWEKSTEAIVQWMPGDELGVVNCLEPHPQIPVIATSGLDDDVKIWVPSCEQEPAMAGLLYTVITNQKGREEDQRRDPDSFDGQMLWILWRHIRRTERNRHGNSQPYRGQSRDRHSGVASSSDSSESSDDEQHLECTPS